MAQKKVAKKTTKPAVAASPKGAAGGKKATPPKTKTAGSGSNGAAAAGVRAWSGAEVGATAGEVWRELAENGAQTFSALKKSVGSSPDMVMAAVGWLAREGKLEFRSNGRSVQVELVEDPPA